MGKKIFSNIPLIIIGAFFIIYIGFGAVYFQKKAELRSLEIQMSLPRSILQKPPPDMEKLMSQLKESEAEFEMTQASLASSNQGIDIYGALVDLGQTSNAKIMSIEASLPIITEVGNETILPYSLVVQGSQSDLLDFISNLIQGGKLLEGLELKSINIVNGALSDNSSILNVALYIHTWSDASLGTKYVPQTSGVK